MISIHYKNNNGRRFHLSTIDCDEHILDEMLFLPTIYINLISSPKKPSL